MKAFVAEESKTRYFAEISLPADFYRAIDQSSVADALRFEPTDEQIVAGWLILDKTVVEMDAGEGKTVAAAFPAIVQALRGREIHVVTANDYLALRDAELLAPVYEVLGLTVGALLSHMGDAERRSVYRNDIVYGTLREFGFDYLRDNLRYSRNDFVQGPRQVAIVDEADHALIDEARTPLIISGRRSGTPRLIFRVKRAVEELIEEQRKLVSSLVKELAVPIDKEKKERFAKLFLADPRHDVVVSAIAEDKKLLSGIRMLVDEYAEDGIDNRLTVGLLYTVDVRRDMVTLTDAGSKFIEERLGPVFDTVDLEAGLGAGDANWALPLIERRREQDKKSQKISRQYGLVNQVHQMLRAYLLLERDEDYIVSDGKVVLIDDLTGRRKSDSKYQHGLQGALEAKEDVRVQPESETLAYLTVEGFVRQYDHVSGMTGTAVDATDQFKRSYSLNVARVQPTNELRRVDYSPRIYATQCEKLDAIMDEMRYWHGIGRPVLVGTRTVEQSDELSRLLTQADIPHNHLNAVTNDDEARIVQEAGAFGAVTVATNMAGRGTDILLGGNAEFMSRQQSLAEEVAERLPQEEAKFVDDSEFIYFFHLDNFYRVPRADWDRINTQFMAQTVVEHDRVIEAGGLHIIGTERHESRRIDNQLRGRSGRQGDPGSSRFYLSLEDDLMRIFGSERISGLMERLGMEEGVPIEHRMVTKAIERAQKQVEAQNFSMRKHLLEYDDVMNKQRENVYTLRREMLDGHLHWDDDLIDSRQYLMTLAEDLVDQAVEASCGREIDPEDWDVDTLKQAVGELAGLPADVLGALDLHDSNPDEMHDALWSAVKTRYEEKEQAVETEILRRVERDVMLQIVDTQWKDHLYSLDHLKEGIGLRGYAQKDPLVEYKRESFQLFQAMKERIDSEMVRYLWRLRPVQQGSGAAVGQPALRQRAPLTLNDPGAGASGFAPPPASGGRPQPARTGGDDAAVRTMRRDSPKTGRNDPCPCGSGKKYKKCHGA